MISYKYKLYKSKKLKALDYMIAEAAFVWNHALALQRRYYRLYDSYISAVRMQKHFAKRIKRHRLDAQTVQELLQRQDAAFKSFFKHVTRRPPKFRKAEDFTSFVFKQTGYKLYGNEFIINKVSKRFRFSKSRDWEGKVKNVRVFRSHWEWYILIVTDAEPNPLGKTHTGASAGIDFGLKTFMTFSDGTEIEAPRFYRLLMRKIAKWQRLISKAQKGSNHYRAYRHRLNCVYAELHDRRQNWFYQTAHDICRRYEYLFVEDLNIAGMKRMKHWGRKINDLGWSSFLKTLEYIASKYGVTVHKVNRKFASSRLCECGYKNDALTLIDREWTCPVCGTHHHRDLHAAQNILRRGIADLESTSKTGLSNATSGMMR